MTATDETAHRRATFAVMDRYNIVKAVVSNDYDVVRHWQTAAPDRIIGSYAFSVPEEPDVAFLRAEHEVGRFMCLGELGLQYEGLLPTDPRMEP